VVRGKVSEKVSLPQANPGNVGKALDGLQSVGPDQVASLDWLKGRDISQPKPVLSMLKWIGMLDPSGRMEASLAKHRHDDLEFAASLRQRVVSAYAKAGCGDRLEWFGKTEMSRDDIRKIIADKGPFAGHDLKAGGHKNAFYCLYALHDWLLDKTNIGRAAAGFPSGASQHGLQADSPPTVTHGRVPDLEAGHEFVRKEFLGPPCPVESAPADQAIRVPFTFEPGGEPVWARIYVEGPLKPAYVAKLGRMLQKAMEDLLE
jgi:hypothetical protein